MLRRTMQGPRQATWTAEPRAPAEEQPKQPEPAMADRKGDSDGWGRKPARCAKSQWGRLEKVDWLFVFSCAAHNLMRLPKLMAQPLEIIREKCA